MVVKKTDYILRYQPNCDAELILPDSRILVNKPLLIDQNYVSVFVWNIFKQKRANWVAVLERYAALSELMLLQEAQNTPRLLNFISRHNKVADHVPAYSYKQLSVGVMTIANSIPASVSSFKEREPLIQVPKSSLITIYPIEKRKTNLLVANLHAINFSLGLKIYRQQLQILLNKIKYHNGPVILAGDFNSWSRQRLSLLYHLIRTIGLQTVNFSEDVRKTFMGRPLDFVFYRGLILDTAQIIDTDSSDHNPLFVQFKVAPY